MKILVFLISFLVTVLVYLPYYLAYRKGVKQEKKSWESIVVSIYYLLTLITIAPLCIYSSTNQNYAVIVVGIMFGYLFRLMILREK